MKLKEYRVYTFRSVQDSGWIECDNVTTLVGVNEAGKSNLLLALWKLNPASGGEIDYLKDMPVSQLSDLRGQQESVKFIDATFEVDADSASKISEEVGCVLNEDDTFMISRFYDGHYELSFPDGNWPEDKVVEANEEEEEVDQEVADDAAKEDKHYSHDDLQKAIIEAMPQFVYYSNYGNLSSKIYLPHAITWLNGGNVSGIERNEEQIRTIRILFKFLKLDPKEIQELGNGPENTNSQKSIEKFEDKKDERSILLQSAGTQLTKKFKDWWKQGDYKFRFEADGNYFHILVSDAKRPDEIGLELRSTGLQWFLSFYLVFLVESEGSHKNTILLLDEAGLTLHPMAQKDLAKFFDALSEKNQIINTTHSPFIIDSSNIDRCRVVYVDKDGYTVASSDLRQGNDKLNEQSIYAVHAALGLSVSDILLQGCEPVIVEGPSDQIYLNMIKNYLIAHKKFSPSKEVVFVPSGGVKGVSGIVSLLGAKSELPYVILDSDKSGKDYLKKLQSGLYSGQTDKIVEIESIVGKENAEIEDLIPFSLLERFIGNKLFRDCEDDDFEEDYDESKAFIPQLEAFATEHSVELEKGYKVKMAKDAKNRLMGKKAPEITEEEIARWKTLFDKLSPKKASKRS